MKEIADHEKPFSDICLRLGFTGYKFQQQKRIKSSKSTQNIKTKFRQNVEEKQHPNLKDIKPHSKIDHKGRN